MGVDLVTYVSQVKSLDIKAAMLCDLTGFTGGWGGILGFKESYIVKLKLKWPKSLFVMCDLGHFSFSLTICFLVANQ